MTADRYPTAGSPGRPDPSHRPDPFHQAEPAHEANPSQRPGPADGPEPADRARAAETSRWGELIESLGAADGTLVPPPPDACAEALGEMFLYLDQELGDPAAQSRIAEHLELCVDCVAAYDTEKLMRAVVARSCRGERASVELRQRIEFFVCQSAHESVVTTVTTSVTTSITGSDEGRTTG